MMFLQNTNSNTALKAAENVKTIYDVTRQSIDNLITAVFDRLPYILAGLLVLLIFWMLAKLVKSVFWSASGRTRLDNRLRILFSRLLVVCTVVLGIFTSMTIIIPSFGFGDLITGLGFTSFVIGFATKDILNNLLSGVLILWQQPFRIGDYIFVGSNQGEVQNIGVRATHLKKDDGEIVLIPNGEMYSSALTIRGAGAARRMILKISIGYDSNLEKAKTVIKRSLQTLSGVVADPKPNVVVTDLTADGAKLSIYFWINTDKDSPLQVFDAVASQVKETLCAAGIVMFPPSSVTLVSPAETDEKSEASEEFVLPAKKKEAQAF